MSTTRAGAGDDSAYNHGLDHVLSSTEFETSQQEQAIQNELDKIKALEREIEEKEKEKVEFERVTEDVETRREKMMRQLQLNRDNIGSLKHTSTVLDEHVEALKKGFESAIQKTENIRLEYNVAVEKYARKWEAFQNTYHNMPTAKELSIKMETLQKIKAEEAALDAQISEVQKDIDAMKSEDWEATVKWVVEIATIRADTEATLSLLNSTRQAVHDSQQILDSSKADILNKPKEAEEMTVEEVQNEREDTPDLTNACDNLPPLPPSPVPQHTPQRESNVVKETLDQGRNLGVFARPQAPPRRFIMPPTQMQQEHNSAVSLSSTSTSFNSSQEADNVQTTVGSSVVTSSTKSTAIPLAFQLQSPKPPVRSSPKLPLSSPSANVGKKKFTFEIPKFSIPPPSYVASTTPSCTRPSLQVQPLTTTSKTQLGPEQERAVEKNKGTSLTTDISGFESSSILQFKMPPKPKPPSIRPPTARNRPCVFPSQHFQLPAVSSSFTVKPKQAQPATSGITSFKPISSSSSQHTYTRQSQENSRNSISKVHPIHTNMAESSSHQETQKQYETQDQMLECHNQYQHKATTSDTTHQREDPHLQTRHTEEQMEVSSDQVVKDITKTASIGDIVEASNTSFDPASTSIDFGEIGVDFDSSAQFFHQQGDESMFNMSQTDSFFNTNQIQSDDYSFMPMANEDESSDTNVQDFFSQFGKDSTSSNTETGKFLF